MSLSPLIHQRSFHNASHHAFMKIFDMSIFEAPMGEFTDLFAALIVFAVQAVCKEPDRDIG